jgi:cell division protein FtsB
MGPEDGQRVSRAAAGGGAAASRPAEQPSSRPKFTSRAAVLVVVVCAIGLSLAYPIREYIAERRQIDQLQAENAQLATRVQKLRTEQHAATSPGFIEQQARDRLNMCLPSQTCYVVISPAQHRVKTARGQTAIPWYGALWTSVRKADGAPPKPPR